MRHRLRRREFLKKTAMGVAGAGILPQFPALGGERQKPNEKVRVGIIGCNGRGVAHIAGYLAVPNTEIAYICDVDSRAMAKGIAATAKKQDRKPVGVKDLRRILDDSSVDAVSIATPDHWHAPAATLAC